uniref:Serine/threonine-protein phosphatase 4 regulatory subunit 3B-like n=2 Tax=Hirondellea gigas TaxID=1518452 RepID=A0A6A7FV95_9CRUS
MRRAATLAISGSSYRHLISSSLFNVSRQEKIATSIESEAYIKKLLDLFRLCEDLENTESLHTLYEIFKNIFLLNKNSLLEVMFADENIFDVIGALEYDPTAPCRKKHRDFLKSHSKFKEVIPIDNIELVNKIHQTFRVQYIQDVALPNQAVYEENIPSTLSSFIFFNKVEIVSMIQGDERFLGELFMQLGSEDVSVDKRRDLVLFLKEFCTFSQTLQPPNRESFYKTLSSFGVLGALECTLAIDEPIIKAASVDVLGFFVEFSPSMVRDYMLQQQHKLEEEHYLLNIMLEQMVVDCDPEMGGAVQLMGILRILIDPENMLATHNKAERADFLAFFYKHSMHYLIAPLLSNTVGDEVVREDYQTAQLVALILELLAFCVEHHSYHIKNYIIHRDLLRRVLVLVKSKHTFLVLGTVRFMRKIIGMKDEFYNRHIISSNLFAPIVDTYVKNNARYNLLDSAILEIFEFIKTEDIKSLSFYSMEKFGDVFNRIEYVQTFITLRTRYTQHLDKIRDKEKSTAAVESLGLVRSNSTGNSARYRRDIREMETEEERWFSNDDCDEDYPSPLKQELLKGAVGGGVGSGLVEEDEEEEEDDDITGGATSPAHRIAAGSMLLAREKLSKEEDAEREESEEEESSNLQEEVSVGSPSSSSAAAGAADVSNGGNNSEGDDQEKNNEQQEEQEQSPATGISLVDYDENSDEEEEEDEMVESSTSPVPKKPSCLTTRTTKNSLHNSANTDKVLTKSTAAATSKTTQVTDTTITTTNTASTTESIPPAVTDKATSKASASSTEITTESTSTTTSTSAAAVVVVETDTEDETTDNTTPDSSNNSSNSSSNEDTKQDDDTTDAMETTDESTTTPPSVAATKSGDALPSSEENDSVGDDKAENGSSEHQDKSKEEVVESKSDVESKSTEKSTDNSEKSKSEIEASEEESNSSTDSNNVISQNGEQESCSSASAVITDACEETKENVTSESKTDDTSKCKKECEQEKKRDRSEERDESNSLSQNTSSSAVKSSKVLDDCSDISSEQLNVKDETTSAIKECSTANGVSDADDLAEGETERKRPRLAVD